MIARAHAAVVIDPAESHVFKPHTFVTRALDVICEASVADAIIHPPQIAYIAGQVCALVHLDQL
jgi:hypothetical protein